MSTEISNAMNVLKKAMVQDPNYAWTWNCNIAMCMVDHGVNRYMADRGAQAFMRLCFDLKSQIAPGTYSVTTEGGKSEALVKLQDRVLDLQNRIAGVLNCVSAENVSNTPDFILAEFLVESLQAFDRAANARDKFKGISPETILGG